jgi:alpha-1,2-mannosyltransferase
MDSATTSRQSDPLQKALTHGLAIWAVLAPLWVLAVSRRWALDLHFAFLPAARAVVHGASPYSTVGSRQVAEGAAFLYPPLSAYLIAPLTLLPTSAAELIVMLILAATIPATLLTLGVRDWRCYAMAFLWWPTIIGIQTGNLTLPMVLGLALVWRYRDRRVVGALIAGFVVALKLFFWPVLLWFVATRRFRDAAIATAAATFFVFVPWAGIEFDGLRSYPGLLSHVSDREGPHSYSVAALLHAVGPSWWTATLLESLLGVGLLALVLVIGRRGRDRDAFALSIVAVLVLSPLLEMHYFALLLIVIALYRPTFGVVWAVPLLIWGAPAGNLASPLQKTHVLVAVVAALVVACWDWRPQAPKLLIKGWEDLSRSGGV